MLPSANSEVIIGTEAVYIHCGTRLCVPPSDRVMLTLMTGGYLEKLGIEVQTVLLLLQLGVSLSQWR